ncbi:hypothetical protein MPHL43239_09955 [Mycolicibacterium phlei DSM 43239 = CCUG 21000]|nr:hypothetical protein MPHL43239_09955 [Mycolicibacterium phlei DSM 43239 = CCUG 21000]
MAAVAAAVLWTSPVVAAQPQTPPAPAIPYLSELQRAAAPAAAWIAERAPQVRRPAVVIDVDETALSNWAVVDGRPAAIPPTLELFTTAREHGVDVFFITGRPESMRSTTERDLRAAGYRGYTRLIMKPDDLQYDSYADFKAPQRERLVRQGFTLIANVGDQRSDLTGGFAEREFLLPNPLYRVPCARSGAARPLINGRSRYVAIPGGAAHTAGTEFTQCAAVPTTPYSGPSPPASDWKPLTTIETSGLPRTSIS